MGDFLHQFLERDSLNDETLSILESNLILLSPHLESLNFAELIENIYWTGENFEGDQENAENIFKNCIEKDFLEIQKIFI